MIQQNMRRSGMRKEIKIGFHLFDEADLTSVTIIQHNIEITQLFSHMEVFHWKCH